jgi:hypothetical protein
MTFVTWAKSNPLEAAMLLTILATVAIIAIGTIRGCPDCTGIESLP